MLNVARFSKGTLMFTASLCLGTLLSSPHCPGISGAWGFANEYYLHIGNHTPISEVTAEDQSCHASKMMSWNWFIVQNVACESGHLGIKSFVISLSTSSLFLFLYFHASTYRLAIAEIPRIMLPQKQALFSAHLPLTNFDRWMATIGNCNIMAKMP